MSLLTGFRILSVEQYGAGPFGTQLLADLGAEVIKIEQPEESGDVSRHVGPHFEEGLPESAQSLFYQSLNCGKKSLSLSLRSDEGRQIFRRLAGSAHAVASNLRGDVPAKLGLTYDQLKSVNPRLVCAHLTGYGRDGERAHWPGYDYLMQAEAGYFALTGEPDSPPARMGLSVVDYMTGLMMSLGITSALLDVQRGSEGCDVDVSLFDMALYNLNYLASWYLNCGDETTRQPRSAHPSMTPCQLYRTRDGWIFLMCNKEKFWGVLCRAIERPEWIDTPRFRRFADRLANRHELTGLLDGVLSQKTTDEWLTVFAGAVPAAPIRSVGEALDAPFARARGCVQEFTMPDGQMLRVMRSPLRTSRDDHARTASPTLGQDNAEILGAIGLSAAEQSRLKSLGVL